jgi:hypothetical protein
LLNSSKAPAKSLPLRTQAPNLERRLGGESHIDEAGRAGYAAKSVRCSKLTSIFARYEYDRLDESQQKTNTKTKERFERSSAGRREEGDGETSHGPVDPKT